MIRYFTFIFLIAFIFVIGCSADTDISDYDDADIVAIVNEEEITVKDLRLLYLDEKALDMIQGTVKARLVLQEAKKMNLDVSEEINQEIESRKTMPQNHQAFAETQAKKFGMEPETYYKTYVKVISEQHAYMNAYIQEALGEPKNIEKEMKVYDKKANDVLNNLVKENEDAIDIFIK